MNPVATNTDDFPELEPGDILLYGGRGLVDRLIQFRTWSDVSHIEIYVGEGRSVASRNGIGVGKYPLRLPEGIRRVYRLKNKFNFPSFDFEKSLAWFSDGERLRATAGSICCASISSMSRPRN